MLLKLALSGVPDGANTSKEKLQVAPGLMDAPLNPAEFEPLTAEIVGDPQLVVEGGVVVDVGFSTCN